MCILTCICVSSSEGDFHIRCDAIVVMVVVGFAFLNSVFLRIYPGEFGAGFCVNDQWEPSLAVLGQGHIGEAIEWGFIKRLKRQIENTFKCKWMTFRRSELWELLNIDDSYALSGALINLKCALPQSGLGNGFGNVIKTKASTAVFILFFYANKGGKIYFKFCYVLVRAAFWKHSEKYSECGWVGGWCDGPPAGCKFLLSAWGRAKPPSALRVGISSQPITASQLHFEMRELAGMYSIYIYLC